MNHIIAATLNLLLILDKGTLLKIFIQFDDSIEMFSRTGEGTTQLPKFYQTVLIDPPSTAMLLPVT